MIVLSIDPGSAGEGNACARTDAGALMQVWFERVQTFRRGDAISIPIASRRAYESATPVDLIVVEQPAEQGDRTRAARPKHLMDLSWDGALLAGAFSGRDGAPIVAMTAQEWKGSEPKPVQHGRLWRILDGYECAILGGAATFAVIEAAKQKGALDRWSHPGVSYYPRGFKTHNLLDAVALNKTYLGLLRKTG